MQFPGRFHGAGAITIRDRHNETALPEVRATIKLEAPHSFDLRDSGDYRRAARDSFGESFQIEVTKMS
jgi:hypothetical protein